MRDKMTRADAEVLLASLKNLMPQMVAVLTELQHIDRRMLLMGDGAYVSNTAVKRARQTAGMIGDMAAQVENKLKYSDEETR